MDFVLNFINIFIPTRATAAALVALLRRWTYMTGARLAYNGAPVVPGVAGLGVIFCIA